MQLPEQHAADDVHDAPTAEQGAQFGLAAHCAVSLQSVRPSQSLSMLSVQDVSVAGAAPQSPAQVQRVSLPLQAPSPHEGATPQSREHEVLFSVPAQVPSPQQVEAVVVVQLPHCEALQPTLPMPPAAPQQKRPFGLPPWRPLQSAAQVRQFSPPPASQIPLPQVAPPAVQSAAHDAQVSVVLQMPLVQPLVLSAHEGVHATVPAQPPQSAPPRLAPSQLSPLSTSPSPQNGSVQPLRHASALTALPSSHCSPLSTMPSPHNGRMQPLRHASVLTCLLYTSPSPRD